MNGFWLVSGLTGGVLMVLMASSVVGWVPAAVRGRVSGFAFSIFRWSRGI